MKTTTNKQNKTIQKNLHMQNFKTENGSNVRHTDCFIPLSLIVFVHQQLLRSLIYDK